MPSAAARASSRSCGGRRVVRRIAQHEHVGDAAHEGQHVGIAVDRLLRQQPRPHRRIAQPRELLLQRQALDLAIARAGRERMERQFQPVEDRHRPRRHLARIGRPSRLARSTSLQKRLPAAGIERDVEQGERQRPARDLDQAAQHGELGRAFARGVLEVVEQLDHALARAAHAAGDRRQLLLGGGDGGRRARRRTCDGTASARW